MNRQQSNRRPARQNARPSRAFTLIELVTVVVVLGLVGISVGGPTLAYLNTIRSRGAAARIAADLRYAQRWAMGTRQRTWIDFNVAADQYTLYVEDPANPGKAGRQLLADALSTETGPINVGDDPFNGAALTAVNVGGTTEVEFDSFGKPYDAAGTAIAADATISLSNGVTLTIRPVTGLVEMSP
ncbi:MAG: prepilin-type N-terminal cleavage/methylation domain-containing protein [Phycisphaerae bacterium]